MNDRTPKAHVAVINGAARTLLMGDTRENCENEDTLKGNVTRIAAQVMARGSKTKDSTHFPVFGNQLQNLGVNRTIPKVESADKANETEKAALASSIKRTSIVAPSEPKA